jgi:homogentisate 1,2-dioxygenase
MPVTNFDFSEKYQYQNGFDSYFEYALSPLPFRQTKQQQPPSITSPN